MYKKFREKKYKCVYLPTELIDLIQARANEENFSSFNKVVAEVLLKEFLLAEEKLDKSENQEGV